ncbi:MAG: hypothetical protein ACUVX8_03140 [Candidatus Zipacnadales bacterium]
MPVPKASYVTTVLLVAAAYLWWEGVLRPREISEPKSTINKPVHPPMVSRKELERWMREEFLRHYPHEKPLNWKIARTAEEFYQTKPMGRFVLHENDCSDFTHAVIDEALGVRARFYRSSKQHLLAPEPGLWDFYRWEPGAPLLPGDEIAVQHSPHYPPYDDAPWHCGIIGTDGMVYDWTKLRSWGNDRYGCHKVAWFTRYCHGPDEVIIRRLAPQYRYRLKPIPILSPNASRESLRPLPAPTSPVKQDIKASS